MSIWLDIQGDQPTRNWRQRLSVHPNLLPTQHTDSHTQGIACLQSSSCQEGILRKTTHVHIIITTLFQNLNLSVLPKNIPKQREETVHFHQNGSCFSYLLISGDRQCSTLFLLSLLFISVGLQSPIPWCWKGSKEKEESGEERKERGKSRKERHGTKGRREGKK